MKPIFDEAEPIELVLRVNGATRTLRVPPMRRLLDVLRDDVCLKGSKEGCGEGECGACTVLVDGDAVLSCLTPVCQASDTSITTVEGDGFEAVRREFLEHGGAQCGICTPGMIVMTRAWIDACRRDAIEPTEDGARTALAGNLCRCTGYGAIVAAALAAASEDSK